MGGELNEELLAAIAAERAAWSAVKESLPGTPSHDAEAWQAWRAAVERCSRLRKEIDAAAARQAAGGGDSGTQAT